MIEELIKRWEQAEVVEQINKGDVYIGWDRTKFTVATAVEGFIVPCWSESTRLISRRVPRVPDDVLVIMAVVVGDEGMGRRPLVRVAEGDELWYTSEEDAYRLEELSDIRVMVEVGDFL